MASDDSPTAEQWDKLCRGVKASLLPEMGEESWYLIIATVLTTSPRPHLLADFWTYLTTTRGAQAEFATDEAQTRLSDRLRDVMLKLLTLIGAPQMLSALIPLAKVQTAGKGEEARGELDLEQWSTTSLPSLHQRGIETITSIYGTLWPTIFRSFGPHRRDVGLHELTIVYGLYLSDFGVLSALETEVVAYTCITAQGLRGPALWHVRGLGRVLGARGGEGDSKSNDEKETETKTETKPESETETATKTKPESDSRSEPPQISRIKDVLRGVRAAVARAVEFCGPEMVQRSRLDGGPDGTQGWPDVDDVVGLGGWGDDE
ncbi:hypothetical protein A1O3_01424 [Capronia epimyces CBS 606.96]|uniref:Uncharacterized protein n=1 Tax=Capronia epimyces CBS 606.96 TaxID=1182542 RepID=W9YT94_9EURO|nr:uncharacterized protein A1O3_01424 [Capronia epimyces CBS 606.96]EXJ92870.1 hypothetical protein A1O3_01424 [Capronia epimyces CBS 606.96]